MMNENIEPKISVIVPMYNSERYITRCIESILGQTFCDWELVLVDDGSTDYTKDICERYIEKDNRVSYFFQQNAGPDYARKKGITEAKGELLLFVDADDYIDRNMLEIMYANIMEASADMVCCQFSKQIYSREPASSSNMKESSADSVTVKEHFHYYMEKHYINSSYGTKLFKKKLLDGYKYLEDSVIGEDVSIVIYLLQQANRIRMINMPLYIYTWNKGSISHSGYSKRHYISLKNYIAVKTDLMKKGIVERIEISGFFAGFEMAVATAMSRNWIIDKKAINLLRQDMKKDMKYILKSGGTSTFMKMCILIYIVSPYLFMMIYRLIYLITGR